MVTGCCGCSHCCGCCFTLRRGTIALSVVITLSGLLGLLSPSLPSLIASFLSIALGLVGCWGAWNSDAKWLKVFFYAVLVVLVVELVFLVVFLLFHKELYEQRVDDSVCDDASDPADCRRMVAEYSGRAYYTAILVNVIVLLLVHGWILLVVWSFIRVLGRGLLHRHPGKRYRASPRSRLDP